MADKQSAEKQALLRAYGAEVVLCPTNVAPESPESYYSVAARLARDIPGAFKPDQYWNLENPTAHERTTGPEIWEQTGRPDHAPRRERRDRRHDHRRGALPHGAEPGDPVVGADPEGSVLSGDTARPYLTEGVGEDFFPGTYDPAIVDRWVRVSDRDAFAMARRITREEGILAGESCGTALVAALEVRPRPDARASPAADRGRGRHPARRRPELPVEALQRRVDARTTACWRRPGAVVRVGELLADRHHEPDAAGSWSCARTTERVGEAIETLQQYGIGSRRRRSPGRCPPAGPRPGSPRR